MLSSPPQELLLKIYDFAECDRALESEHFVPLEPAQDYLARLRGLVNEEKLLWERRQRHFCDKNFKARLLLSVVWWPRWAMRGRSSQGPGPPGCPSRRMGRS